MMGALQVVIIIFGIFAVSRAYLRLREGKLSMGQFLFWIILWSAVVGLTFVPGMINIFSETLGINRPIDLVVYFSIVLLFYLIFRIYIKISEVEREITELVSKIAKK